VDSKNEYAIVDVATEEDPQRTTMGQTLTRRSYRIHLPIDQQRPRLGKRRLHVYQPSIPRQKHHDQMLKQHERKFQMGKRHNCFVDGSSRIGISSKIESLNDMCNILSTKYGRSRACTNFDFGLKKDECNAFDVGLRDSHRDENTDVSQCSLPRDIREIENLPAEIFFLLRDSSRISHVLEM
jgi:hypothetical protein